MSLRKLKNLGELFAAQAAYESARTKLAALENDSFFSFTSRTKFAFSLHRSNCKDAIEACKKEVRTELEKATRQLEKLGGFENEQ